ncbi:hypothetical protein Y1Q_0004504 [Alligator mississippiensis]|uniref:Uncharacterized protein n=1 Tax=Alligator mississippiensis TaxID=8496 RepID=A0A151NY59_ALLMI|nr:hypothetical protein Y1Q_0004504 [Alligator mississippiensis]
MNPARLPKADRFGNRLCPDVLPRIRLSRSLFPQTKTHLFETGIKHEDQVWVLFLRRYSAQASCGPGEAHLEFPALGYWPPWK